MSAGSIPQVYNHEEWCAHKEKTTQRMEIRHGHPSLEEVNTLLKSSNVTIEAVVNRWAEVADDIKEANDYLTRNRNRNHLSPLLVKNIQQGIAEDRLIYNLLEEYLQRATWCYETW